MEGLDFAGFATGREEPAKTPEFELRDVVSRDYFLPS